MKLYADYIKEREGLDLVSVEMGFATYKIHEEVVYIQDIYVAPEYRRGHVATELAEKIAGMGKEAGCKYITGSVCLSVGNPTDSMRVLLAYGMEFLNLQGDMMYFKKEL